MYFLYEKKNGEETTKQFQYFEIPKRSQCIFLRTNASSPIFRNILITVYCLQMNSIFIPINPQKKNWKSRRKNKIYWVVNLIIQLRCIAFSIIEKLAMIFEPLPKHFILLLLLDVFLLSIRRNNNQQSSI